MWHFYIFEANSYASEKFKPLKKSKGSKRKEVDEASRLEVVETLAQFGDNDYARVFRKRGGGGD
jgi:type I restriction enzyme M protein